MPRANANGAVVTRFAPSPTGHLHAGGARTALFNWALARSQPGGRFLLRMEDTDRARSQTALAESILADLRWLGLDWDGEPVFQSARTPHYQRAIAELLESDLAYPAFETPGELDAMRGKARERSPGGGFRYHRPPNWDRAAALAKAEAGAPHVIRLHLAAVLALCGAEREIFTVEDQVLGTVEFAAEALDDFVLQRQDGGVTYHLAVVVDDAAQGVTHVLRGQEHLARGNARFDRSKLAAFNQDSIAALPPAEFKAHWTTWCNRYAGRSKATGEDTRAAGAVKEPESTYGENTYWEDIEPQVRRAVRQRIEEFQEAGIRGVDLFLASFGPALEAFSRHWPLRRGRPRPEPEQRRRRRQQVFFGDEWDPYAATPEDALDVARREVKLWRLEKLTHRTANADLDPSTAFFVLAWDTFRAPVFSYEEALKLAHAVGVDLEDEIVGRLAGKSGSNIQLWDSAMRAAKGVLGSPDGRHSMIDALHHAAHIARSRSLETARELLESERADQDSRFIPSLEALLEVLPPSGAFTGVELKGQKAAAGDDFEALYKLVRLAYGGQIDEPDQLRLWKDAGG